MSRRRGRGRPSREYRLRVRAVRRDPIDYEALARAALEQAAMDQREGRQAAPTPPKPERRLKRTTRSKEELHDRLA